MAKLKYIIDVVLISCSVIVALLFFNNINPMAIAPLNNQETNNTNVLFEIRNADYILIDDNIEFSSPEKVFLEDSLEIKLSPGTYYWKILGEKDSEVRKITILSRVDLTLRKQVNSSDDSSYEVVNSGNENLNVDVYDQELFTQSFTLSPSGEVIANGTKFVGGKI